MEQPEFSPIAKRLEKLNNLYYLMVGLPLLAFSWVYLNLKLWEPVHFFRDAELAVAGHVVLIALALALSIMAFIRYRRYFQEQGPAPGKLEGPAALEWKVGFFCEASIQKYALLAAATILIVLGFYLSLEEFYVPLYAIMLIVYSVNRPTPESIARDMRMKKEERKALQEEVMKKG